MYRSPTALAMVLAAAAGCADVPVTSAPDLPLASSTLQPTMPLADKASTGSRGHRGVIIEYRVSANVIDRYEFWASNDSGPVQGRFRLLELRYFPAHPLRSAVVLSARGRVVCLQADGNRARLGGIVTRSTFPQGIAVGSPLVWSVTDNGPRGWSNDDTASPLLGGVDPLGYCANGAPFDEVKVKAGNIIVDDDDADDSDEG